MTDATDKAGFFSNNLEYIKPVNASAKSRKRCRNEESWKKNIKVQNTLVGKKQVKLHAHGSYARQPLKTQAGKTILRLGLEVVNLRDKLMTCP